MSTSLTSTVLPRFRSTEAMRSAIFAVWPSEVWKTTKTRAAGDSSGLATLSFRRTRKHLTGPRPRTFCPIAWT